MFHPEKEGVPNNERGDLEWNGLDWNYPDKRNHFPTLPPAIHSPPSEDADNDEEHNENQNKRNRFPTLPAAFYSPPPDADADTENDEFYDIMKKNHFLNLPPGTYTPPDDIDYIP